MHNDYNSNPMFSKVSTVYDKFVFFYMFVLVFWDHLIQFDEVPFVYLNMVNKDTYTY